MILKPTRGSIFVKWLHSSIVTDVACLECESCENFWSRQDFFDTMRSSEHVGGYVATDLDMPIGFLVYENCADDDCVRILNMVMRSDYRRQGIATLMIEKVKGVMNALHFHKISTIVRDSNFPAHMFFQKNGFAVDNIVKCYFEDQYDELVEREDGYEFVYKLDF